MSAVLQAEACTNRTNSKVSKEVFQFKIEPNYIDPINDDQEIILTLTPKIEKLSSYNTDLNAQIKINTDTSRLEPKQDLTQTVTFSQGQTTSAPIKFSFSLTDTLRDKIRDSNLENKEFRPIR